MVSFEEITELYGVYIIFAIIGIFTILTVRFYSKKIFMTQNQKEDYFWHLF